MPIGGSLLRDPRSDARGIKTWLTRERAKMLEEFVPRDAPASPE